MCSLFTSSPSVSAVAKTLGAVSIQSLDSIKTVAPYTKAPVFVLKPDGLHLDLFQFSLIPRWSKEKRVKFATHNARLDTIDEKPTFKEAFKKRHCLVPMFGFQEPVYTGPLAGNMIQFEPTSNPIMFAAGIYEDWVNKESGEVLESFSVITDDPIKFVLANGHDRSPLFLGENHAFEWLKNEGKDSAELKAYLSASREDPALSVSIARPLKAGWEKRK